MKIEQLHLYTKKQMCQVKKSKPCPRLTCTRTERGSEMRLGTTLTSLNAGADQVQWWSRHIGLPKSVLCPSFHPTTARKDMGCILHLSLML